MEYPVGQLFRQMSLMNSKTGNDSLMAFFCTDKLHQAGILVELQRGIVKLNDLGQDHCKGKVPLKDRYFEKASKLEKSSNF